MHLYIVAHACDFQVDSLERDAFEVLRLVRSIKNLFAPINRVPPEILSLLPDYCCEIATGLDLIALTHICRSWRDTFTSHSSLWTRLNFKDIEKICTYIQCSRSSPLEFYLEGDTIIHDVFSLVIPHIPQLKSLTVNAYTLPSVLEHFHCHVPLLEKLDISVSTAARVVLDSSLFNRDLSSLRDLRLGGVITRLPWKNLANLQVFDLNTPVHTYRTTQHLDIFESAPLLHTVFLTCSMPSSSDAPLGQIVRLPRLKTFSIMSGMF